MTRDTTSMGLRVMRILLREEKFMLVGVLLLNALVAAFDVVTVLVVYEALNGITESGNTTQTVNIFLLSVGVGLLVLRAFLGVLSGFGFSLWSQRFLKRIMGEMFQMNLTRTFVKSSEKSEAILIRDIQNSKFVLDGYFEPLFALSREILTGIGIFFAMLAIDIKFSLITFTLIASLGVVVTTVMGRVLASYGAQRNDAQAVVNELISEATTGSRETRLYNASEFWQQRFRPQAAKFARSSTRFTFALLLPRYFFELVAIFGVGAGSISLWFLGYSTASIVAIVSAMGVAAVRLAPSAAVVSASWQALKFYEPQVEGAIVTIEEFLGQGSEDSVGVSDSSLNDDTRAETAIPATWESDSTFLDCVGLQFRRDAKAVPSEVFTLRAPHCGLVAITGPSGSGKSTVIDGLLGFAETLSGEIYLRGNLVTELNPRNCRIGLIEQRPFIMSGTIRDNLCFGLSDALSDDDLSDALDQVGLGQRFSLDDVLKARGTSISGGQAYRIAIARNIVRKSEVLFLDEPTSALDSQSTEVVRGLLESEARRRLVVVSTHDQKLAACADQVIKLI